MKVLAISHSCVISEYQNRMAEVAKFSDLEIKLLVPKYWFQFNKRVDLEKKTNAHHQILAIQPITWGFMRNGLRNAAHVYPGIRKVLGSFKPDIIELWEEPFSAVAAHAGFWANRVLPKGKVIFFSAQNVFKSYPFPFSRFEKYTYKNAQHAYLMSKDVVNVIRKKGYKKEFTVLPLGVDADIFCKKEVVSLKERLGIGDFVVGFIGKITKQKGILDLVEAVSRTNKEIQLLIIGNGDLRKEVENRVKELGLGQRAVIIDAVPHSQVPDYLNCMNVLILPSVTFPHLKEQFGRVLIEAMACQVPVIGSNSGEIPTTIGKAGLIFKEGDVKDLKEKIEGLMRNRDLRALLAKRGRKRVLENFSWKVIAKRQHQVYTELMSGGNDLPDRQSF